MFMINTSNPNIFTSKKILNLETAEKKISELKKKNKKVGLCHGGFDILHPGHIKHFESAKKMCDYLIVSITSDKFVLELKGNARPIFSEKLRAYSVASIESVDFAVVSDFLKGIEVIKTLKPNYYIKGPDYTNKDGDVALKEEIEATKSVGGGVKFTKDPKFSTTEIIEYIKENF